MSQKPALGKGLASLFPGMGAISAGPATTTQQVDLAARIPGVTFAGVDDIRANKYQPRRDFDEKMIRELADSIRSNGVIQPLIVRRGEDGGFHLIAGERRLRAARLAGLKQVPVVVRKATDREALEVALIENIQRQDLNCVDEALAYFQLVEEFSLTQEEIAKRVGKERATVANYLRLLKLPEVILDDLKAQKMSFGHGKALLALEDMDQRMRLRDEVLSKHLSVRETELRVEELKALPAGASSKSARAVTPLAARFASLSQEMTRQWSTRVEMKGSERRGKIIFHYASRQDLDRILETLQNQKV